MNINQIHLFLRRTERTSEKTKRQGFGHGTSHLLIASRKVVEKNSKGKERSERNKSGSRMIARSKIISLL